MLSYLSALCTALLARDVAEVRRLLERQGAPMLPRTVRDEISFWLSAPAAAAPVQTLRHYHRTRQLLLTDEYEVPLESAGQLELPLGPLEHRFGGSLAIARAARFDGDRRRAVASSTLPSPRS